MSMFCYQCEQTFRSVACRDKGVCGKTAETAALQDLLVHATKGVSMYAHRMRRLGVKDHEIDLFVVEALFTTVTNVNFDPQRIAAMLQQAARLRDRARGLYEKACEQQGKQPEQLSGPAQWTPEEDVDSLVKQGISIGIEQRLKSVGSDLTGLEELLTYGLKGMAAYADHASILGQEDDSVFAFFHEALEYLTREKEHTANDLLGWCLRCGEVNLTVMGLLDTAHTTTYGHPEPTQVRVEPVKGKAIVVSGHDLKDLEELLKQTEGKGINVYTHGEILPALAYPGLKKHKHLVGNYGGAWQAQAREFDAFPGAILMNTNCIQEPKATYKDRVFTCGLVAWPGVTHIKSRDFSPVIKAALAAPGFTEDGPDHKITIGFGHHTTLSVADKVIEAVKAGAIRHFFLIGGCDGAKPGRNYYTELAQGVPDDCVILTLACGKYRFNKLHFGEIGGIPRLLDCGQCNDAYSAIQVAVALAKAFNCGVNELPLSLILSWYEQKACVILLTLLHLGIKNIRLGPSLPAFITPAVLQVLVDKFNVMPVTTPQEDLKAALAAQ